MRSEDNHRHHSWLRDLDIFTPFLCLSSISNGDYKPCVFFFFFFSHKNAVRFKWHNASEKVPWKLPSSTETPGITVPSLTWLEKSINSLTCKTNQRITVCRHIYFGGCMWGEGCMVYAGLLWASNSHGAGGEGEWDKSWDFLIICELVYLWNYFQFKNLTKGMRFS